MGYLIQALEPAKLRAHVQKLTSTIQEFAGGYDAIAVTGNSGAIPAGILSINLNKPIIIIRKGESSHGTEVELPSMCDDGTVFTSQPRRYIIIDDGISTGATIIRMRRMIAEEIDGRSTTNPDFDLYCVGIFCYNQRFIGTMNREMITDMAVRYGWDCPIICDNRILYKP